MKVQDLKRIIADLEDDAEISIAVTKAVAGRSGRPVIRLEVYEELTFQPLPAELKGLGVYLLVGSILGGVIEQ